MNNGEIQTLEIGTLIARLLALLILLFSGVGQRSLKILGVDSDLKPRNGVC
jgi:hypothetical protein